MIAVASLRIETAMTLGLSLRVAEEAAVGVKAVFDFVPMHQL
jgi:hypothetical protein